MIRSFFSFLILFVNVLFASGNMSEQFHRVGKIAIH